MAKDYATTYTNIREEYLHMYHTGDAIAGTIAKLYPDKFPGNSMSDEVNLRSALDRLLSEHASLAAFAIQKEIDGAADFSDVAGAFGKKTDDLTAAILRYSAKMQEQRLMDCGINTSDSSLIMLWLPGLKTKTVEKWC